MIRNLLLITIIVLLLWSVVILSDIRQALYQLNDGRVPRDKNEAPEKSPKWTPGELTPKPQQLEI